MSFFRKVRVLVGSWVHKPFMPRSEKIDLDEEPDLAGKGPARKDRSTLETQEPQVADTERVADLIVQKQQEEMD
jgi:hypothetical protein